MIVGGAELLESSGLLCGRRNFRAEQMHYLSKMGTVEDWSDDSGIFISKTGSLVGMLISDSYAGSGHEKQVSAGAYRRGGARATF